MTITWYFAYGSNMNPDRMAARGLAVNRALAGKMHGFQLCFNKRATGKKNIAYANVGYSPGSVVEGVLYQLKNPEDITLMDPFEGTPYRYSRDVFLIQTAQGDIAAWVYVANQAMLAEGLLPEQLYLNHLLAGKQWHSDEYQQWLSEHPAVDNTTALNNSTLNGLTHNV